MFLAANHVSYTYNRRAGVDPVSALRDVSVGIARGSLTGLIGPNGCGKTTLLKLLAGVLTPDSGTVTLDGRALTGMSRRQVARRIAVVPQETHPAFEYTALEMALMGRHPHLGPFQLEGPDDLAIARGALTATGTSQLADRSYMTLSGGEKQRVVIASALAQSAEVLLLDEPTASLDPDTADWVRSKLEEYCQVHAATVVLASHNMAEVERLAGRVIMLEKGRIIADETPQQLIERFGRSNLEEVFLAIARRGADDAELPR
jgi:ABC-type cobalamin/Fe3+-siderophores transport system ATPase subunit